MALITNGYAQASSPLRYSDISAGVPSFGGTASRRASVGADGKGRNLWAGDGGIEKKSSIPSGARHPVSWRMAPIAGGMSSRNETFINMTNVGNAVLGISASSSVSISLTGEATGGLIVSGTGLATISFTATGSVLSVAAGQGAATITLTPTAAIGAQAGLSGSATVILSPSSVIYATGSMSGISTSETEFSAAALASAVWNAAAAAYGLSGTMGEKLNDAGSAANPWTEVIESGYTAADIMRLLASVAAGNATGLDGSNIVFRDINDTKDRITATVSGGTREATDIDAT